MLVGQKEQLEDITVGSGKLCSQKFCDKIICSWQWKKSFVCSPSFVSTQVLNKTPDFSFITPGDIFMPVSPPCRSLYPPCFLPSFLPRPLYLSWSLSSLIPRFYKPWYKHSLWFDCGSALLLRQKIGAWSQMQTHHSLRLPQSGGPGGGLSKGKARSERKPELKMERKREMAKEEDTWQPIIWLSLVNSGTGCCQQWDKNRNYLDICLWVRQLIFWGSLFHTCVSTLALSQ